METATRPQNGCAASPAPRSPDTELLERLRAHRPPTSRYEVRREIGRGGMGAVYSVWDPDLRRELAMKVCGRRDPGTPGPDEDAGQERLRALFLEEAQITGQLGHPGIVPVHELGIDEDGRAFFTMPLVRGKDLEEIFELVRREQEGWTQTRALGVFLKVCEAMAFAHSRGVVHRDLKPANVMVGRFGETYVMDWGIARIVGKERPRRSPARRPPPTLVATERSLARDETPGAGTISGRVVGTPSYMAPEQAFGDLERLGPRSDVYAVGAMLYHLLTGRRPYVDPDDGEDVDAYTILGRLMHTAPEPLAELAPDAALDLVAVCEKAMARDPRDRYADTMEMAADLERFLDRRPVRAQPATLGRLLHLAYQRNRKIALTVATAALVVFGMSCVFVNRLHVKAEEERAAHLEATRRGDVLASQALVDRERELHPAVPAMAPELEEWLADVADLSSREDLYRAELALPLLPDGERAKTEEMLAGIERLASLRGDVAARLAFAEGLAERTSGDPAWDQAIEDVRASDLYGGLVLEPQLGLVPLRRNPESGLWEFWHAASGDRPVPDGAGYAIEDGTGMVLVLVPGGSFTMGAPEDEPGRQPGEVEHEVEVEPFFLSRYEVTQAQYARVLGENPSLYQPREGEEGLGLDHPVESVGWTQVHELARRLDLRLPGESEWEYACRAGSRTAYADGDVESLEGMENVYDESAYPMGFEPAPWKDGHQVHAPCGSFRPNAFGLHDMQGNVSEWCADAYAPYPGHEDPKAWRKEGRRVFRGGSWYLPVAWARAAFRQYDHPDGRNQARGARLARDLRP